MGFNRYNIIENFYKENNNTFMNHKRGWYGLNDYQIINDKINDLIVLDYFLTIRNDINKIVRRFYPKGLNIESIRLKINETLPYCDYSFITHPNLEISIYKFDLDKLINDEIAKIFKEIEQHNYKLHFIK